MLSDDENFIGFQHGNPVFIDMVERDDDETIVVLTMINQEGKIGNMINYTDDFFTVVQHMQLSI